jgi:hypothetical protein
MGGGMTVEEMLSRMSCREVAEWEIMLELFYPPKD